MEPVPGILAVTADVRFYSCVQNAAGSLGWNVEWASSLSRGLGVCRAHSIRIVIFDRNLPDVDWRYALQRLSGVAAESRILLAAPEISEDLWRTVLRQHGYDVLTRSANSEQMKRELRFAWLSLCEPQAREQVEIGTPVLS
jgi:DNA-binding response OmpR family regulator